MIANSLNLAIKDWQAALGNDFVSQNNSEIENSETATFLTDQKILILLNPASVSEVQTCVQIANKYNIPFYPVSGGHNCGYGSRVPSHTNSVIINLSRLNKIINYDKKLAYVILEPGVTQTQLFDFLKSQGGLHWIDPIRSSPECSIVGNILERGHGMTPYGDRIASSCNLEVVLPTGEIIHTGYGMFPDSKIANLDRWGLGPSLDGLFSQSNFGIITRMTVWLMPTPEYVQAVAFKLSSDDQLAAITETLRPLRLDGTLRMGPRFVNEYRLIQNQTSYPWESMDHKTPLSADYVSNLSEKLGIPKWSGFLGLYGSLDQVEADRKKVIKALTGLVDEIQTMDQESFEKSTATDGFSKYIRSIFSGMIGQVVPMAALPYWRKKSLIRTTLEKDRCGIIWCPTSCPFTGDDLLESVKIYREIITAAGFEPDISISAIRDRTLEVNVSIVFDRESDSQDQNALRCAHRLIERLLQAGFPPHRVGLQSFQVMDHAEPAYRRVLQNLNLVIDPKQKSSLGRYVRNSKTTSS